jgi:hypothetical protein
MYLYATVSVKQQRVCKGKMFPSSGLKSEVNLIEIICLLVGYLTYSSPQDLEELEEVSTKFYRTIRHHIPL